MATLVFKIETIGELWDDFDDTTQKNLSQWILRMIHSESERERALIDLKESLKISPLTGIIATIGLYDIERKQGVVYYSGDTGTSDIEIDEFICKTRTEKGMLQDFWDGAQKYDTFITFCGRSFDAPFLNIRSAIQGVRPSCDLMEGRYFYQQKNVWHIDLQDQMTFYGATRKRSSLHMYCRAFGIKNYSNERCEDEINEALFLENKFKDAVYRTVRDVVAITELYKKWDTYLAPQDFLNSK